jgi:hypothetical protein
MPTHIRIISVVFCVAALMLIYFAKVYGRTERAVAHADETGSP